jgi:hypothetical protein
VAHSSGAALLLLVSPIVFGTATTIDHFRAEASIVMSIGTANLMIIGKTYDLVTFNTKFIQDALQ